MAELIWNNRYNWHELDWHIPGVCRGVQAASAVVLHATEPLGQCGGGRMQVSILHVYLVGVEEAKLSVVVGDEIMSMSRGHEFSGRPGRHDPACK